MLAILGASGKLGYATLTALLTHNLLPPTSIICTSSSDQGTQKLQSLDKALTIRRANFDDPASLTTAIAGCESLFLISSSRIALDFHDAPPNTGREADHIRAIEAAKQAGVQHIYYTSLAFANPSKSRVMQAHERTEAYLKTCGLSYTVLREGLYSESWPLYFGHYTLPQDGREEVLVAGDGRVSWTAIADLGVATAMVLGAARGEFAGKVVCLAQRKAYDLEEVARMVSKGRGREVGVRVVGREEKERFYVEQRGMDRGMVEWWAKTDDALADGECEIDEPMLEELLAKVGREPKAMEETVAEMLGAR